MDDAVNNGDHMDFIWVATDLELRITRLYLLVDDLDLLTFGQDNSFGTELAVCFSHACCRVCDHWCVLLIILTYSPSLTRRVSKNANAVYEKYYAKPLITRFRLVCHCFAVFRASKILAMNIWWDRLMSQQHSAHAG